MAHQMRLSAEFVVARGDGINIPQHVIALAKGRDYVRQHHPYPWSPAERVPLLAAAADAEVLIERPDGSRITVIVNIRPLKNQSGDVSGAINCFYDITSRKRVEDCPRYQ
jgi:PAS domain-containing protein